MTEPAALGLLPSCDHEIVHLETVTGGTRQYVEGLTAFLTVGNAWDEERVTLYSLDRSGLAAALRRAADEIEGIRPSPHNLPPVTVPMGEVLTDWTCIGCERTFSADQPKFIGTERGDDPPRHEGHDICIDCSH